VEKGGTAMSDSPHQPHWSIEVYHVLDHERQQRILEAFRDIGRADVTALGSQNGHDWYVTVETSTGGDKFFARSTICAIDRHATRAYSYKSAQLSGPLPAS
jgi:hypothetical protein